MSSHIDLQGKSIVVVKSGNMTCKSYQHLKANVFPWFSLIIKKKIYSFSNISHVNRGGFTNFKFRANSFTQNSPQQEVETKKICK